jgi:hypothetical protein
MTDKPPIRPDSPPPDILKEAISTKDEADDLFEIRRKEVFDSEKSITELSNPCTIDGE